MKLTLSVPDYSPETGLICEFEDDYRIGVEINDDMSVCIKADKGGLVSLAKLMLTLSSDHVPDGTHMHFDSYTSLEDGSCELIIAKGLNEP